MTSRSSPPSSSSIDAVLPCTIVKGIAGSPGVAVGPALVVGSQTMVNCTDPRPIAEAIEKLGLPTWLGGTSRGLLGRNSPTQFRHARGKALKDADVAIVCGFPFDFRMKYGLGFGRKTKVISANLSAQELRKNRTPDVAIQLNAARR